MNSLLAAAAGAGLALTSFLITACVVRAAFRGGKTAKIVAAIVAPVKLALLIFLLWWIIVKIQLEPLAFLIGISSIVASILLAGLFRPFKKS